MRRKKAKPHIVVKCDYCGSMTDRFVVNMEHKRFCRHQYVGFPPERDCMGDYIEEKKNVQKEEKLFVLDQGLGLDQEVKQPEEDGDADLKINKIYEKKKT